MPKKLLSHSMQSVCRLVIAAWNRRPFDLVAVGAARYKSQPHRRAVVTGTTTIPADAALAAIAFLSHFFQQTRVLI